MKYREGDRVKVRQWKALERQYRIRRDGDIELIGTPYYFIKEKKYLCGKIVTIEKVFSDYYYIKEDGGVWEWTDEMFEGMAFEYGEVVEFSNDGEKWTEGIYVAYIDGAEYPNVAVDPIDVTRFKKGMSFAIKTWRYTRPVPKYTNGVRIKLQEDYRLLKEIFWILLQIVRILGDYSVYLRSCAERLNKQ